MTFAVQRPLEGRTGDGASCMKVRRLDPIGLALGMNVVAWTFSMAFGRLPWQRWKRLTVSGTLRGVQAAGRLGLRLLPVTPLQPRLEPHRATPGQDQRQTAQRSPGPQTCVTGRLDQPWATSPPQNARRHVRNSRRRPAKFVPTAPSFTRSMRGGAATPPAARTGGKIADGSERTATSQLPSYFADPDLAPIRAVFVDAAARLELEH